ncbi:MAG: hypothetical protein JWP44_2200 [Mucilaginibacter sp.]|nr:hypothetical protein [Mucilaginibacter sp.]
MNMKSPKEEKVAKAIEQQTARLPSDIFLWAAIASIGGINRFKIHQSKT